MTHNENQRSNREVTNDFILLPTTTNAEKREKLRASAITIKNRVGTHLHVDPYTFIKTGIFRSSPAPQWNASTLVGYCTCYVCCVGLYYGSGYETLLDYKRSHFSLNEDKRRNCWNLNEHCAQTKQWCLWVGTSR